MLFPVLALVTRIPRTEFESFLEENMKQDKE